MDGRTNYLAVGVFIVLGALALLVVGAWVGGVGQTVPVSTYTIIFERDVNGLSAGSPVRYMGVDVGQVGTIQLSGTHGDAVEVQVEVAKSAPIDSGTYASLAYQGITGVAFINLAADAGEHAQLVATDGRSYPVIPSRDVGIAALLSSGPEVMGKLTGVLDDAGTMLDENNREAVVQILANIELLTDTLARQSGEFEVMPARVNASLSELQATLENTAQLSAEAGPDLAAATRNLRQSSENLANITGRVEKMLTENDAAIDGFLADGVGEMAALITDTRATMREMQKLGAELRSNPSRIIYRPRLEPVVVAQ